MPASALPHPGVPHPCPPRPLCPRVSRRAAVGPRVSASLSVRKVPDPACSPAQTCRADPASGGWSVCEQPWNKPSPPPLWRLPTAPVPCLWTAQPPPSERDPVLDPWCPPELSGGLHSGPGPQQRCPRAGQPRAIRSQCSRSCLDDREKATAMAQWPLPRKGLVATCRGSLYRLFQSRPSRQETQLVRLERPPGVP